MPPPRPVKRDISGEELSNGDRKRLGFENPALDNVENASAGEICEQNETQCGISEWESFPSPIKNLFVRNGVSHQNNGANGTSNGDNVMEKDAGGKSNQSYLALTKLGMGQKEAKNPAQKEAAPVKKSESPTKTVSKGRKSMAEMASSTLKGFTKM